jgi:hypothetical protein
VITGSGPVLAMPKIVPVFFSNDDMAVVGQLVTFLGAVGATKYWNATTSEYGVGPATATPAVMLTEAAPATIDDNGIQTWLAGKLNGNDPAWPAADSNTVYALHYPSTTTISQQSPMGVAYSCQTFGGYHNSITLDAMHNAQNTAYAVIPRCANFDGLHGVDAVTAAESHELIEAVTDPYPMVDPAYAQPDQNHIYWLFALGGGETGDMCAQFPGVFTKFTELPNEVQRTWSNASAAASHDPCVPELAGEVYFNSAPVLKDNIVIAGIGSMKGVHIPLGTSKVVELDLFSEADTGGPWDVEVKDFFSLLGQPAGLTFSLDRTSGQNGEKLHVTIDAVKKNQYGVGIFLVISSLGQRQNWWLGLVGN